MRTRRACGGSVARTDDARAAAARAAGPPVAAATTIWARAADVRAILHHHARALQFGPLQGGGAACPILPRERGSLQRSWRRLAQHVAHILDVRVRHSAVREREAQRRRQIRGNACAPAGAMQRGSSVSSLLRDAACSGHESAAEGGAAWRRRPHPAARTCARGAQPAAGSPPRKSRRRAPHTPSPPLRARRSPRHSHSARRGCCDARAAAAQRWAHRPPRAAHPPAARLRT
jgi:hypothetical protein